MSHAACRMPHACAFWPFVRCGCLLAFFAVFIAGTTKKCLKNGNNSFAAAQISSSFKLLAANCSCLAGEGGRDGHKPVAVWVGEGEGETKLKPGETQIREGVGDVVEAVVAQGERRRCGSFSWKLKLVM